jgi:hypothetical protein
MRTIKTPALVSTFLILAAVALAQENQFGNIAERQRTSTVLGGTGMSNTFSTPHSLQRRVQLCGLLEQVQSGSRGFANRSSAVQFHGRPDE